VFFACNQEGGGTWIPHIGLGGGSARGVEFFFGTYLKSPSNKPKKRSQRSWEVQMYGKHQIYVFTVRNSAKTTNDKRAPAPSFSSTGGVQLDKRTRAGCVRLVWIWG
jgi:hypothetical protein